MLARVFITCFSITGIADYQFQPDMSDPLAQLRLAMDRMDGKHSIPVD
jgi:hypothetical protein